jgi:hypothetical protein
LADSSVCDRELCPVLFQFREARGDLGFELALQFGQGVDVGGQPRDFADSLPSSCAWVWVQRGLGLVQVQAQRIAFAAGAGERYREFVHRFASACTFALCSIDSDFASAASSALSCARALSRAADRIGQHELADGEDQQQEHQHHQQRAERIDEAGPEVDAAPAPCEACSCLSSRRRLPSIAAAMVRDSRRNSAAQVRRSA